MSTDREKAMAAMHHAIEKHGASVKVDHVGSTITSAEGVVVRITPGRTTYTLCNAPDACHVALTLGGWRATPWPSRWYWSRWH